MCFIVGAASETMVTKVSQFISNNQPGSAMVSAGTDSCTSQAYHHYCLIPIDWVCLAILSYCIAIKLHTGSTDMCGPARGVVFLTHHHQMRKNRRICRTAAAVLLLLCNFVNANTHVSSVSISPTGVLVLFFKQRSKSWSYISNLGLLHRAAGFVPSPAPVSWLVPDAFLIQTL